MKACPFVAVSGAEVIAGLRGTEESLGRRGCGCREETP